MRISQEAADLSTAALSSTASSKLESDFLGYCEKWQIPHNVDFQNIAHPDLKQDLELHPLSKTNLKPKPGIAIHSGYFMEGIENHPKLPAAIMAAVLQELGVEIPVVHIEQSIADNAFLPERHLPNLILDPQVSTISYTDLHVEEIKRVLHLASVQLAKDYLRNCYAFIVHDAENLGHGLSQQAHSFFVHRPPLSITVAEVSKHPTLGMIITSPPNGAMFGAMQLGSSFKLYDDLSVIDKEETGDLFSSITKKRRLRSN